MSKITTILFFSFILTTIVQGMVPTTPEKAQKKSSLKRMFSHHNSDPAIVKFNSKENFLLHAVKDDSADRVHTILHPDINQTDEDGNTPFIIAAQKNNGTIIDMLLKRKQLKINAKNKWEMTGSHYLALNNSHTLLEKLLQDPRFDSSIKNADNRTVRELLDQSVETINLRRNLFARITLDMEINYRVLIIKSISDIFINPFLTQEVEIIKSRIFNTQDKQNDDDDRKLPEQALLPDYATNDFIAQTILLRLKKRYNSM